jgi:hypothetical protein
MNPREFQNKNLLMAAAAVTAMAMVLVMTSVSAAPTQAPPNGNPAFPAGPQGPQGVQGPVGNYGPTGNQGPTGAKGPVGVYGIADCSWNGAFWVSHGWDGVCSWDVGAFFNCDGSRIYSIQWNDNRNGDTSLCGTYK